ncbi:MAG TPA: hypothetical protein PLW35_11335, partial [Verrucomicrobiota bacterium]|nr:hypothetical protein [Verrucomicrobiota bacterium]
CKKSEGIFRPRISPVSRTEGKEGNEAPDRAPAPCDSFSSLPSVPIGRVQGCVIVRRRKVRDVLAINPLVAPAAGSGSLHCHRNEEGGELSEHWQEGGLIGKKKDYVVVYSPQERARNNAFPKRGVFTTMVDALHQAVVLWGLNRQRELHEHLSETYGSNEVFWQVAQAISEVLPDGDEEKQALQGLLYGRKVYHPETRRLM